VVHPTHFVLSRGIPLFGKSAVQTSSGVVLSIDSVTPNNPSGFQSDSINYY
jgi:hypothetical protein